MKDTYLTANEVIVLMNYYVFGTEQQINEPWANNARIALFGKDLIKEDNDNKLYITAKGAAMIAGILSVPEPVQKWVMP